MFKKISTNVARAKQVAMAKMGQSEQTVDAQFNQEEQRFKEQYKKMKKLSTFITNYQTSIKDLHVAQAGMSQMLLEQYDSHHKMYQVAAQLHEKTTQELEGLRQRLDQYIQENFHQPLSMYLAQYKEIEARISERNRRLVDMDRYRLEVKQMMDKAPDPQRLQMANQKAEAATATYNDLNQELLRDIPRLVDDRSSYFDSLFANIVDAQLQYLKDATTILGPLESGLQGVNRSSHQNHQRVITDPSTSASASQEPKNTPYSQPAAAAGGPYQSMPPQQMPQQHMPQQQIPQQQVPQQRMSGPGQVPQQQGPPGYAVPMQQAPPQVQVVRAQALYPFQGQDNTELSFQFGDVISVLRQGGEWWEGELNGRRGLFPSNYVKLL